MGRNKVYIQVEIENMEEIKSQLQELVDLEQKAQSLASDLAKIGLKIISVEQ